MKIWAKKLKQVFFLKVWAKNVGTHYTWIVPNIYDNLILKLLHIKWIKVAKF